MYPDQRQTKNYAEYIKKLGWEVDEYKGVYIYIKKILYWKFIKIQRPSQLVCSELLSYLVKEHRHSTVYIEPVDYMQYEELQKYGFKKYNSPFLPSKTVQIDLTKSKEELLGQMHHKTRYNCKKVTSDKLQVTGSDAIDKFAEFWQECAKKRGMFLSQKKEIKAIYEAFGKDAVIHVAKQSHSKQLSKSINSAPVILARPESYRIDSGVVPRLSPSQTRLSLRTPQNDKGDDEDKWLAAILRISTKDTSYYMYVAASDAGKKLFAPTMLTWEAIRSAKKEGKKIFDFEGVYDDRFPLKSWKGFSRFKKSFGGLELYYPGCLSKIII